MQRETQRETERSKEQGSRGARYVGKNLLVWKWIHQPQMPQQVPRRSEVNRSVAPSQIPEQVSHKESKKAAISH